MAVAEQSKFFVNLTGGLNTDATKLTFPDEAATDLDNVDILRNGEVRRRLGAEFESAYQLSDHDIEPTGVPTAAISSHEWLSVNGKGDINFLAIQVGSNVYFHDLGVDPISSALVGQISIQPFAKGNGVPGDSLLDASFGEGVMIMTNPNMDPIIVEYDEDAGTFSATAIEIRVRDFEGISEDLRTDEQPTSLTKNHRYNLWNQGWPKRTDVNRRRDGDKGIYSNQDPINWTFTKNGKYPSNADIIYLAQAPAADDPEVIGTYSPFHLNDAVFGNTPAPKGHYILPLFDQNRASVAGEDGIPLTGNGDVDDGVSVDVRPTVTAFYAGRVWYGGIPHKDMTGDVYFSQSLTDVSNAGECYQANDPTAQDVNQVLATDGGAIHFADMGQVYKMETVGSDLMIIAANGVWAVSGTSGANFAADDFTARKVTDIGTVSGDSVLEANDTLWFWNKGGIYTVAKASSLEDREQVVRVSKDRIQTFYDAIPAAAKAYARGFYDNFENRIYWFYNDDPAYDAINLRFKYNRVLAVDLTLTAFYTYTISDLSANSPFIAAMTQKEAGSETVVTYDVVDGLDTVEQAGDEVVQDIAFPSFSNVQLKLLTFVVNQDSNYEYTFSEFNDRTFKDWTTWDQFINNPNNTGADFSSFVQAGWQQLGDPIRTKKITSLDSIFNRTETGYSLVNGEIVFDDPSSCNVQVRWEYSDLDNGRWTTPTEAYRLVADYLPVNESDPFDYGYEVIQTKLRMRGKGRAFSVRYSSNEGKDFQLLGYAVNVRAGAKV
jgi:hypothetical protein